jgi:hypothetical protein
MQTLEDAGSVDASTPRVYAAAAVEHIRCIAFKADRSEAEDALLDVGNSTTKAIILTDALTSMHSGRPHQISDADIAVLHPHLLLLRPEDISLVAITTSPLTALTAAQTFGDHIIHAVRHLHAYCTGPLAGLLLDPAHIARQFDAARELLERLLDANETMSVALARCGAGMARILNIQRYCIATLAIHLRAAAERRQPYLGDGEDAFVYRLDPFFCRAMRACASPGVPLPFSEIP